MMGSMRMKTNDGISSAENDTTKKQEKKKISLDAIFLSLVQEARAVSLWSFVSIVFRITLIFLATVARYRDDQTVIDGIWFVPHDKLSAVSKEIWMMISVLSGWFLCLAPSKVLTNQSPGFIFANPSLLLWVREKAGVIPNVPARACEYVLGRINLLELILILPIHMVVVVSTSVFLQRILPETIAAMALEPINYADGENPWIVDLCREVFITAVYTVALMVLPVLFRLNHIPKWAILVFFYPMFQYAVDANGKASSFSPNVVLAFSLLGYNPLPVGYRIIGSMLGGLVGGKVMQRFFPDETK